MAAPAQTAPKTVPSTEFIRGIGPLAAISLVVGSMIGSGIFIVSADISRQVSPWGPGGLLLVWVITGADDRDRRAGLCRAGGDDAEGRRTVRVPPRGPLAGRGIPLRLDPLRRHPDRHHRRRRGGVRPVPERAGAGGEPRCLPAAGTAPPARRARRDPARPLAAARRRDPLDRCSSPGSTSAGSRLGAAIQTVFTVAKVGRARGAGAARPHPLPPAGRRGRQLRRLLGHGRLDPGDDPGDRRGHGRLALLQRRMEQRDLRRRGGAEPEPEPAAWRWRWAPGW